MSALLQFHKKFTRKLIRHPKVMPGILRQRPKLFIRSEALYIRHKDPVYACVAQLCDPSRISLDIGVLWGAYTLEMQRHSKAVVCFEPNPEMVAFLQRAYANDPVTIHHVAASDAEATVTLRIPRQNPGNATIEGHNPLAQQQDIQVVEVQTTPIDRFDLEPVGFIKIDVEGHELAVLHGMKALLQRDQPNLLIESEERHHPNALAALEALLRDYGYALYFLLDGKLHPMAHFDAERHQNYARDKNSARYVNNFICIPDSRSETVLNALTGRWPLAQ
ncbi:MAG: FkbM family methyltransferase [Bacteroidota bacterium]